MTEQIRYYKERAREYELVYQKPERQRDLASIRKYLSGQFTGRRIIEVACGTGYWTEILSRSARSVLAADINPEMIEIAKSKAYSGGNVAFGCMDIHNMPDFPSKFEGLFGGFIWSHILREDREGFLRMVAGILEPGATVLFLDNKYVEGSSTPVSRTDRNGNTYQNRRLISGEQFEVLKNFPEPAEMKELIEASGTAFEWIDFPYYWLVKFRRAAT